MYWDDNGRKRGGAVRMVEISKRQRLYLYEYRSCVFRCATATGIVARRAGTDHTEHLQAGDASHSMETPPPLA